jgi:hypothetical protein
MHIMSSFISESQKADNFIVIPDRNAHLLSNTFIVAVVMLWCNTKYTSRQQAKTQKAVYRNGALFLKQYNNL